MKKILTIVLLLVNLITFSQNKPNYPQPKEGFKRVDLLLPKLKNQENLKVEVKFAFELEMLDCENGSFSLFPNILSEKFGIGISRYPYYVIEDNNIEVMVMKSRECENQKENNKTKKIIYSNQEVKYNYQSSYTVPFYIPENWNLVYRVWSTSETYTIVK